MKELTIEIHGTSTQNRGAELMAIAVGERMRATFPNVRIAVPPNFGPFESRAHRFFTTWEFSGRFRALTMVRLMPNVALQVAGIIDPHAVDVVLDASGFAFSDQWGPGLARHLVTKMSQRNRRHQMLILLPQAFGPFKDPAVAGWTKQLLDRSSLVCARDERSLAELRSLHSVSTLRLFPDFTVGLSPLPSGFIRLPDKFVAIVPNKRMMDKGNCAAAYVQFLKWAINLLRARELNPVFVLHDASEDSDIVAHLQQNGEALPVFEHADPRVLKWILGRATLVIGSRFHALVSALSQGVPCIGAGWSHKYPELFADFNCSEFLIADLANAAALEKVLKRLATKQDILAQSGRILAAAQRVKERNETMWREVEALIQQSWLGSEP